MIFRVSKIFKFSRCKYFLKICSTLTCSQHNKCPLENILHFHITKQNHYNQWIIYTHSIYMCIYTHTYMKERETDHEHEASGSEKKFISLLESWVSSPCSKSPHGWHEWGLYFTCTCSWFTIRRAAKNDETESLYRCCLHIHCLHPLET